MTHFTVCQTIFHVISPSGRSGFTYEAAEAQRRCHLPKGTLSVGGRPPTTLPSML